MYIENMFGLKSPWSWSNAIAIANIGLVFCAGAPRPELLQAIVIISSICLGYSLLIAPAAQLGADLILALAALTWIYYFCGNVAITTAAMFTTPLRAKTSRLCSLHGVAHVGIFPVLFDSFLR